MFVPVGCTHCGKPFQVPETALGNPAVCPWCQSVVTALPVGAAVEPPAAAPTEVRPAPVTCVEKPGDTRPLSLDDDPPKPSALEPSIQRPRTAFRPLKIAVTAVVSFAVLVVTVAALGYGSGRVPESGWAEYAAPDGSCSVLLPAPPIEESVEPNPAGSVTGGKRYVVRGWYTRSAAWLAWSDLEPAFAEAVAKDKDRAFTASAIRAELEREKGRLQGTVTKEAEVRLSSAWGVEVHMDAPRGKVVERLFVTDGARPRLYVCGVQATNITHESAVVQRMFTSFKLKWETEKP